MFWKYSAPWISNSVTGSCSCSCSPPRKFKFISLFVPAYHSLTPSIFLSAVLSFFSFCSPMEISTSRIPLSWRTKVTGSPCESTISLSSRRSRRESVSDWFLKVRARALTWVWTISCGSFAVTFGQVSVKVSHGNDPT